MLSTGAAVTSTTVSNRHFQVGDKFFEVFTKIHKYSDYYIMQECGWLVKQYKFDIFYFLIIFLLFFFFIYPFCVGLPTLEGQKNKSYIISSQTVIWFPILISFTPPVSFSFIALYNDLFYLQWVISQKVTLV